MKAKYNYLIDGRVLLIEDQHGLKSLTNDIETALADISEVLSTSLDNFNIIYRDSEGLIDGIHTHEGRFNNFYPIQEISYYKAKLKIQPKFDRWKY